MPRGPMTSRNVTCADLAETVYRVSGLQRNEAVYLVEQVLSEIGDTPARGEPVKRSRFGPFSVRESAQRIGRKKMSTAVPIEPRRVMPFTLSGKLNGKSGCNLSVSSKIPIGLEASQP